jgi:Protein of unknown function (DUF1499)
MALATLLVIVVVFLALIIFVPFFRSMLRGLIRFAFLIVVIFFAAAGTAILMNNETIFDSPGWKQRAVKFVTEDSAATSEKGYGEAPCALDQPAAEQRAKEEAARAKLMKKQEQAAAVPAPSGQSTLELNAQPTATPTPSPDEINANLYDELMTRNYICQLDTPVAIGRAKLLGFVQQTIAELKGWKLIGTDERTGVLNCVYTSQVFGVEDEVRILVTPRSDIEICSQSKSGEPQSGSLLGFFPGDFGANMGHIKQFYAAIKEKTDAFCTELAEKQKPKGPGQ